jgi:hypothetical protein
MPASLSRALLIAGLVVAAAGLWLLRPRTPQPDKPGALPPAGLELSPSAPPRVAPPEVAGAGRGSSPAQSAPQTPPRLKKPASELRADEQAAFAKEFVEKLKPAVEHWSKIYEGHLPFRPEEVTPDKFRERFGDSPALYDYGFVINGTTLSVVDYHGEVFVAYLMSPAAALLLQIPKNPEPPKPVSVTREEVLRLLKADSGRDFPPEQITWHPTAYAGAMNGGVSVDVGEGVNGPHAPFPRYSMVFGPDGNLACYGRRLIK